MDQILEIAAVAFQLWRIALCAIAGAIIAGGLNLLFPALPTAAYFATVFLSASLGVIWHVSLLSAREAARGRPEEKMSRPIAFLGIALIGGLWSQQLEAVFGITIAFAITFILPWLLGPPFAMITKRPIRVGAMVFASIAVIAGLATPRAIALAFQIAAT